MAQLPCTPPAAPAAPCPMFGCCFIAIQAGRQAGSCLVAKHPSKAGGRAGRQAGRRGRSGTWRLQCSCGMQRIQGPADSECAAVCAPGAPLGIPCHTGTPSCTHLQLMAAESQCLCMSAAVYSCPCWDPRAWQDALRQPPPCAQLGPYLRVCSWPSRGTAQRPACMRCHYTLQEATRDLADRPLEEPAPVVWSCAKHCAG